MKKTSITILASALIASCNIDEPDFQGPAIAFYPDLVAEVVEGGAQENEFSTPVQISLEATGELNQVSQVEISFDNYDSIITVPEHENGVFILDIPTSGVASFTARAGDDARPDDYVVTFEVTALGGDFVGIADSKFTLFVEDDDFVTLFEDNFNSGFDQWEVFTIEGNDWRVDTNNGNADISNFRSNGLTESWLISDEIDLASFPNLELSFDNRLDFNSFDNQPQLFIVKNYVSGTDPSSAELIELDFNLDSRERFSPSGTVDLTTIQSVGRLAFYYKAVNSSDGSGWAIDNLLVQYFDPDASDGISNDGGGLNVICPTEGTDRGIISLPYNDDFENCGSVAEFDIPSGWFEVNAAGSKTDRGWGCRAFGNNNSNAPAASAFGGTAGFDDAWLITDGKVDLTSITTASIELFVESPFDGEAGTLGIFWSEDYLGEGDPSCANWSELTDFPSQLPKGGSKEWTKTKSSLDVATGKSVYIAFRYQGPSANVISYNIDDLSITGN